MHRIIYASRTARPWSDIELAELLTVSRENNERDGLGGLLLYTEQTFLQLLEGETEAIGITLARILADPRHHDVRLLDRAVITERTFPGWSMGFRSPDAEELATLVAGYRPVRGEALIPADLITDGSFALDVLRHFGRHG